MCIMGGNDVQPYNDSKRFNVVVRTLYHSECEKDSNNLFDLTDKAPGPSPSIAQHTAVNTRPVATQPHKKKHNGQSPPSPPASR